MPMIDVSGAMSIILGEGDITIAWHNGDEPPFIMFSDKYGRMATIKAVRPEAWGEVKRIVDEVFDHISETA